MKTLASRLLLLIGSAFLVVSSVEAGDRQAEYLELRRMIGNEQFDEAFRRCVTLIEQYPDFSYLYETLAEISLYQRDFEGGRKYFEERIENGTELGLSYYGLGMVYYLNSDYRTALRALNKAIEIGVKVPECFQALGNSYENLEGIDRAITFLGQMCYRSADDPNYWYALALAYWSKRDYAKVIDQIAVAISRNPNEPKYREVMSVARMLCSQSDQLLESVKKQIASARMRGDIVRAQFLAANAIFGRMKSEKPEAIEVSINEMLYEARKFGLFRWLGWGYKLLADIKFFGGDYQASEAFSNLAYSASSKANDNTLLLSILIRQFEAYIECGDYESAMNSVQVRMSHARLVASPSEHIHALSDLAWLYHEMEADQIALEYAVEALSRAEALVCDPSLMTQVETTLGLVHAGLKNFRSALNHYKSACKHIPKDSFWAMRSAVLHGNLGNAYLNLHDFENAKKCFDLEFELSSGINFRREQCTALQNLGNYYLLKKNLRRSKEAYLKSLRLGFEYGVRSIQLLCMRGLGRIADEEGLFEEAASWYNKSIEYDIYKGSEKVKTGSQVNSDYRNLIRLQANLGQTERAFHLAETAKLRIGQDVRFLSRSQLRSVSSDALRSRAFDLRKQLEEKLSMGAYSVAEEATNRRAGSDLSLLTTIARLEHEYRKLLDTVRLHDSNFRQVLEPSAANLTELRTSVLPCSTAILEYVVGELRTEAFVLTADTLLHFGISMSRDEILRHLRRLSKVTDPSAHMESVFSPAQAGFESESCARLYNHLVRPAQDIIAGCKHLVIVPDDCLKALPFEVLVVADGNESAASDRQTKKYLVQMFEVSYSLAASRLRVGVDKDRSSLGSLLAVGNPYCMASVARQNGHVGSIYKNMPLTESSVSLPGAEREVDGIKRLLGTSANILVRKEATKATFKLQASQYRILHVAAHATYDETWPMYSGIELASDGEDPEGHVLRAFEFLNMDLNAELVVLSGCNTGRSRENGEANGLVRALYFAGVPSVISTLWSVEDESAARLVGSFYRHLKEGKSKSKALQLAKIELIEAGKSDPFYWGAFVLVGDPSPIDFSESGTGSAPGWIGYLVVPMVAIILLMALLNRREPEGILKRKVFPAFKREGHVGLGRPSA